MQRHTRDPRVPGRVSLLPGLPHLGSSFSCALVVGLEQKGLPPSLFLCYRSSDWFFFFPSNFPVRLRVPCRRGSRFVTDTRGQSLGSAGQGRPCCWAGGMLCPQLSAPLAAGEGQRWPAPSPGVRLASGG